MAKTTDLNEWDDQLNKYTKTMKYRDEVLRLSQPSDQRDHHTLINVLECIVCILAIDTHTNTHTHDKVISIQSSISIINVGIQRFNDTSEQVNYNLSQF